MFYQINELIEVNLQLLFKSENKSLMFSEFKDKNGKKLDEMIEFFQIMEKEKLIEIENRKCNLTEFGKSVIENGGWFEHLKKIEKVKIEKTEVETKKNEKINVTKNIFKSFLNFKL